MTYLSDIYQHLRPENTIKPFSTFIDIITVSSVVLWFHFWCTCFPSIYSFNGFIGALLFCPKSHFFSLISKMSCFWSHCTVHSNVYNAHEYLSPIQKISICVCSSRQWERERERMCVCLILCSVAEPVLINTDRLTSLATNFFSSLSFSR